jgi:hypothetical protein
MSIRVDFLPVMVTIAVLVNFLHLHYGEKPVIMQAAPADPANKRPTGAGRMALA